MNDDYRRIFQLQYDEFYGRRWEGTYSLLLLSLVRDHIEKSVENAKIRTRLRIDAKYFLLINTYEMIAQPVLLNQLFRSELLVQNVLSTLDADLTVIINAAKLERLQGEITGGDILRSLAKVYDKLKITNFEVWG